VTVRAPPAPRQDSGDELVRFDASAFRLLFAANPLPMWVYDVETTRFLEVNEAAIAHYGYSHAEFLAMRITEIRPDEEVARFLAADADVGDELDSTIRRRGSWKHRLKDGRVRDVEIAAQTLRVGGRRAVLVVANDVTDLKQAQHRLARYAERLNLLHEIDKAVIAAETPVAFVEPAIRRLRDLLGVPRAIVSLFDLEKNEAEWLVAVGRRRTRTQPGLRFPMVYMGDVESMRRGEVQMLHTARLPAGPEVDALLGSGVDAYIVVPMLANAELIGGVSFGGAAGQFSAEQLRIAQEVAVQLAIAISHARLHENAKRHARELEARVRERTVELHATNERLEQEIAERRRAQMEADRANRLKSEFLANMSHELRTPLNAIIGFTELIHDGLVAPGSPQCKEFLGDILSSGRHLLQLINDVLDLSKVEAGKLEFHAEPVDLGALAAELLAIMRTTAAAKEIRVESSIAPLPDVVIDPARLKQILYNYLSNALKFTPHGGHVMVRVARHDEHHFRLEVEDNGIGIAPGDIDRLFVEFQQLEGGVAKRHEGTGLGLALTRRLAEAQGGSVSVTSSPGAGSVFRAILPLRAGTLAATPNAATTCVADDGAATILVVEDSDRDRETLCATLVAAGYTVESATTGAQALAKCRARIFDAITLDLLLPDMSGLEALRSIRASTPNRDVPVIVVTVVTERGVIGGYTVHDLLAKPLDRQALVESLERAHVTARSTGDVLVVDDDSASRRLMSAALGQLGYTARCISNGDHALRIAQEAPPIAVVLDLIMPAMTGFEFLDRFRSLPDCRSIPVLVWTVKDLTAEEHGRLQSSVQAVISKGCSGIGALTEDLRNFLVARRGERAEAAARALPRDQA
jgi:PAS domain S-box-containing protein